MKLPLLRRLCAARDLTRLLGGSPPPALPRATVKILQILRDPDVSFDEVGEAIEWDPTLTVKLLATVNSAAFAPKSEIHDVRHAITYLGRAQLESLALAVVAQHAVPTAPDGAIDAGEFWTLSARRAATARAIAERVNPAVAGAVFTAALLADFAIPVLASTFGPKYTDPARAWQSLGTPENNARERKAVGVDHAHAGGLLARAWGLPDEIADAIECHHQAPGPGDPPGTSVAIVQLVVTTPAQDGDPDAVGAWARAAASGTSLDPEQLESIWSGSSAQAAEIVRALA